MQTTVETTMQWQHHSTTTGVTIYVDARAGSDSTAGTAPSTALQTLRSGVTACAVAGCRTLLLHGDFYGNGTATIGKPLVGLTIAAWGGVPEHGGRSSTPTRAGPGQDQSNDGGASATLFGSIVVQLKPTSSGSGATALREATNATVFTATFAAGTNAAQALRRLPGEIWVAGVRREMV